MPLAVTLYREALIGLGRPGGGVYTHWLKLMAKVDRKAKMFLSNDMVNVRTGNLRSSQQVPTVQILGTVLSGQAVNIAKYARFVHDGTRPHAINATNKNVLTGWTFAGAPVFTPSVWHPGTQARPWLRRALTETMAEGA